jgi:LmbE family N-acetylglucosaminyl deacetylase
MIVPLVKENTWLEALQTLPAWLPTTAPVVIVSPHPDDETLGTGGFIASQRAQGIDVGVVAVTDGENAYSNSPELGKLRRVEQEDALKCLGVPKQKIFRFGLPDSSVESRESDLTEKLSRLVTANTYLIAPWKGDFHPDHQACGRAAEEVARRNGATLVSYFFWTWHFGEPSLLAGMNMYRFPLDEEALRSKGIALSRHRSQLIRTGEEPILPERLLGPARRPFEVFAFA